MKLECPEGVEVDVNYYFTSPSTGVDVTVGLKGLEAFSGFDHPRYASADIAKTMLPQGMATDWRVMTRQEIKDYKAEQNREARDMRERGYDDE